MGLSAAVAGASGYAGGELLRLLDAHPDLSVEVVAAASNAGELVTSVHPHLRQFSGRVFEPTDAATLAQADVVFLALPHGQSAAIAAQLPEHVFVVDLGADFRLRDPAQWVKYYGGNYAGAYTYGLPELPGARGRNRQQSADREPGVLRHGHHAGARAAVCRRPCGAGRHRRRRREWHDRRRPGDAAEPRWPVKSWDRCRHTRSAARTSTRQRSNKPCRTSRGTPSRSRSRPFLHPCHGESWRPAPRGQRQGVSVAALREAFDSAYAATSPSCIYCLRASGRRRVRRLALNSVHLQVAFDEHAGRIVVVSALDNLTKGAAGQAIQNANIALGFDETTALPIAGVTP